MKKNTMSKIFLFIFVVIVCLYEVNTECRVENLPNGLNLPSRASFNSIASVFDDKTNTYDTSGFFPQIYESSLQATYYGLYILDSIGRLDILNKSKFTQYIMGHYNYSSHLFMDNYAYRYLDTDFSHSYYPLSTVLEVNCYAILSLSLLDELSLINIGESINFLWSCYNPVSSGFIGQPYDSNLENNFKISTMDNTYFAVTTLDLLMGSWSGYITQKNELIQYTNSLQVSDVMGWKLGGFKNDNSASFDSLTILFEPNLLSSFYSIKTLEVFGMESTINYPNFYNFLGSLYDPTAHYFRISLMDFNNNFTNLVATAIGLELSDVTGFPSINRAGVINFLFNNRNSLGMWDGSTTIHNHGLIDTFQIIRVLKNINEIEILTFSDKDQIASNSINYFSSRYNSFFLLSKDYTTINLLHTIIKSFDLYDRVSELEIQELFVLISGSYYYNDYFGYDGFISYTNIDDDYIGFRSYPIEFYSAGNKRYIDSIGYLLSHKATFQALTSLKKIFKLDDFTLTHDLSRLLGNIIDTQFLNSLYPDQHGGFSPIMEYDPLRSEFQSKNIFLEYSFYAIKAMELLSEYLGLGGIDDLIFDKNALSSFIHNKLIEDVTTLYFQPSYSTLSEDLIENTYYAVFILKQINFLNVDEQKIANFVIANINYSNMKSVYFSYKLSKLITPGIYLNYDLIFELIGAIYDDTLKEYYLTTDRKVINQDNLLWICDMVVNDLGTSATNINIEHLESCEFLSTGNNITFSINSKYSGTYWFWVDGELVDSNAFQSNGDSISISLDSYTNSLGDHTVKINATALDGHYGETGSSFSVYSDSSTIVNILSLNNYEYNTTDHNITFSVHSDYPELYNLSINDIEISSGIYFDGQVFTIPIDGYEVGNHEVVVWARSLDNKEGIAYGNLSVYSTSETIITIHSVDNYVYNSTGNFINFSISSDFQEYYTIEIDGFIVDDGFYLSNIPILHSIDGYNVGLHAIIIWANSTDKKEASTTVYFDVFSESFLEIEIQYLQNYEFKSIGNYILFFINASFPDSFKFYIEGALNGSGMHQYGGELFNFSIDDYFVGEQNVSIWANSTDGKQALYKSSFTVYSLSNTIVSIEGLPDHEFLSTGNFAKFNISSLYPDYYILSIDGIEVKRGDYESGVYYYVPIDGYTIGYHPFFIWAIGEDGKIGTASGQFNVYSNSTTIINVNQIPNYEFMTTGNNLNFSISSKYIGIYNVSINGILIDSGSYTVDEIIVCSSDGYTVGNHNVSIYAKGIDGKEAQYNTVFIVFSNSTTLINILALEGFKFMSSGNYLNFTIDSNYPDYYELWINGFLVSMDNYSSGNFISYSLDNYSILLGNHSVYIWAIGKDFTVGYVYAEFSVYSASSTIITINELEDVKFLSNGNNINFTIFSTYPDYYELWINGFLVSIDNYSSGSDILYSLDSYANTLGNHTVFIWAIGLDGKVGTLTVEFEILSLPNIISISLIKLDDYEYNSTGNELQFRITSKFPNYYMITIDNIVVWSENYTEGELIIFSIDNYEIGLYNVTIWAIGLDEKEAEIETVFTVYSKDEVSKSNPEPDPPITAFILSSILIIIPSTVFGVSHRYKQKIKSILSSKNPKSH